MAAAAAPVGSGQRRITRGYGLIESLKTNKPAKVVALDEDGEILARINVAEHHNRWAKVLTALEELDWYIADLYDKKDGLLYRHKRNHDDREPAGHLQDLGPTARISREAAELMQIFLRGIDGTLSRYERGLQGVLDVQSRLVESATRRLEASEARLAREQQLNNQLSSELLAAQISASLPQLTDGEEGEPTQASGALATLMPAILRAFAAGAVSTPEKERATPKSGPKNGNGKPAAKKERQSDAKPSDAAPAGD